MNKAQMTKVFSKMGWVVDTKGIFHRTLNSIPTKAYVEEDNIYILIFDATHTGDKKWQSICDLPLSEVTIKNGLLHFEGEQYLLTKLDS